MDRETHYDESLSLGDILSKALKAHNGETKMIKVHDTVNFIKAAQKIGRSNRSVIDMLENDELDAVLAAAIEPRQTVSSADRNLKVARIENYWRIDRKIEAIKQLKELLGYGLLETKQFVEGTRSFLMCKAEYNAVNSYLNTLGDVFLTN